MKHELLEFFSMIKEQPFLDNIEKEITPRRPLVQGNVRLHPTNRWRHLPIELPSYQEKLALVSCINKSDFQLLIPRA